MNFFSLVQGDVRSVEALMEAQADGYNADVAAALRLLLKSGGKRMRPAVTILIGRMLGADPDRLVTLSAAIELLHTATLVHDDLIDGSLLRRGTPTLNSQWSAGATVLTGDFLFARAAKLAADTHSIPVTQVFAHTLTVIVDGELTQMFASRCQASREDYDRRIYAKTASLFETCARAAALISPAADETVEIVSQYGRRIGAAFQIVDDVLDFTGEQATLGKPVGSDLRQGLVTLPVLYYVQENPQDPAVQQLLRGRCVEASEIERLVDAVRQGNGITAALQEARQQVNEAVQCLQGLPTGVERQALEELARYIVDRNH